MNELRFAKTEAWISGWRGKTSLTELRCDGKRVGEIRGDENPGMAGAMNYGVSFTALGIKAPAGVFFTLKEAKQGALDAWASSWREVAR